MKIQSKLLANDQVLFLNLYKSSPQILRYIYLSDIESQVFDKNPKIKSFIVNKITSSLVEMKLTLH